MINTIGNNTGTLKDGVYSEFSIAEKRSYSLNLFLIINGKKYFKINDQIIKTTIKNNPNAKLIIKKPYYKIKKFLKENGLEGEASASQINHLAILNNKDYQAKLLQEFIVNIFDQWIDYIASTVEFKNFTKNVVNIKSFTFKDDVHRNNRTQARKKIDLNYCKTLLFNLKISQDSNLTNLHKLIGENLSVLHNKPDIAELHYKNVKFNNLIPSVNYNFNDLKMAFIDSLFCLESKEAMEILIKDIFESGYNKLTFSGQSEYIQNQTKEIFKKYFLDNIFTDKNILFDFVKNIYDIPEVEFPLFFTNEKYEKNKILESDPLILLEDTKPNKFFQYFCCGVNRSIDH